MSQIPQNRLRKRAQGKKPLKAAHGTQKQAVKISVFIDTTATDVG
jgi:hypothetical protein